MAATDAGRDEVLVGVVVRVHGLRGEVVVESHTDSPGERFAAGTSLAARDARGAPRPSLSVTRSRAHSGRMLVTFDGVDDRDAADELRGTRLLVPTGSLVPPEDPDEFHAHQLEGLRAELPDGSPVGTVREVVYGPGGELLVLSRPGADDALVPFVTAIVPTVDVPGGRIVLDPPEGLLDPVD